MATIVKKACKCYHCGATLNVGDVAQWYKRTAQGFGHMQKTYSLGYTMICASEQQCNRNLGDKYRAKQAIEQQKKAQEMIDFMRTGKLHGEVVGMVIPEEMVQKMIAKFAAEGITVV